MKTVPAQRRAPQRVRRTRASRHALLREQLRRARVPEQLRGVPFN